jgi:arsenite methyltransferase
VRYQQGEIMGTLEFNEEAARRLEILYSTPDVRGQREEALHQLRLRPGEAVIDIGCGPGYLSESMAEAVAPGGRVLALDISKDILDFARRLVSARGRDGAIRARRSLRCCRQHAGA